jgi:hypothetical protein
MPTLSISRTAAQNFSSVKQFLRTPIHNLRATIFLPQSCQFVVCPIADKIRTHHCFPSSPSVKRIPRRVAQLRATFSVCAIADTFLASRVCPPLPVPAPPGMLRLHLFTSHAPRSSTFARAGVVPLPDCLSSAKKRFPSYLLLHYGVLAFRFPSPVLTTPALAGSPVPTTVPPFPPSAPQNG